MGADPNYDKAFTGLGLVYLQEEEYDSAILYFNKAVALNTDSQVNYYNRGIAHHALDAYEQAESDYSVAIRLDESAIAPYISRADLYHEMGNYDLSIVDYTEAIFLSAESPILYYNRGISYYDFKSFEKAIGDFLEVLRLDSSHIDARWYLALSFKALGNEAEAIRYYDEVESLNTEYAYLWAIDKNQLRLKQFIRENWIFAIGFIALLLVSLFFVRKLVKNSNTTEID